MIACVVGAGAREHALAHALAKTVDVIATPGNPGIAGVSAEGHSMTSSPSSPREIEADLFVIGPEVPLVDGLADALRADGHLVFGPGIKGARLEGSKAYMKDLAHRARVPTARFAICHTVDDAMAAFHDFGPPYVVKTDGLAAGKGVLVTSDVDEAVKDASMKLSGASFGDAGRSIVVEEGLFGEELSLLVLTDGERAVALPAARDYKRIYDGDLGPNTGGMGAFSPIPSAGSAVVDDLMEQIVEPTLALLRSEGVPYRGVLYAGCMLTEEGPKLIEFNVRFGDPEAEVVLPRIASDFAALATEVAAGALRTEPRIDERSAVCVVLSAKGYPGTPQVGEIITGVAQADTVEGVTVFHGGTSRSDDGSLITAGGRVLTIAALGDTLESARVRAYAGVDEIDFPGMHFRSDVAVVAPVIRTGTQRER